MNTVQKQFSVNRGVSRKQSISDRLARVLLAAVFFCLSARGESPARTLRVEAAPDGWLLIHPDGSNRVCLSRWAPLFDFGDCQIGGKAAGEANWRKEESGSETRWLAEWSVKEPRPADIRATLKVLPQDNLLRKTAELRLAAGPPLLLRSVLLDEVEAFGQAPTHHQGWPGYPILGRAFHQGWQSCPRL